MHVQGLYSCQCFSDVVVIIVHTLSCHFSDDSPFPSVKRAKVFPSVVADDPFQFYSFPIGLVQRRSFPNFYCCVLTPLVQLKIEQRVKKNIENYLKEKYIIIKKFPMNGDQQIQVFQNTKEKLTSHVPKLIIGQPRQITMTSFFKRAKTVRYAIRMSTHESKQAFPLVRRELARGLRLVAFTL